MRMRMLKNSRGSANEYGSVVQNYTKEGPSKESPFYEMTEPWQIALAEVFISTHRAVEVAVPSHAIERETKEDGRPDDTSEPLTEQSPWHRLRAAAAKALGKPVKDKKTALKILRREKLLG